MISNLPCCILAVEKIEDAGFIDIIMYNPDIHFKTLTTFYVEYTLFITTFILAKLLDHYISKDYLFP